MVIPDREQMTKQTQLLLLWLEWRYLMKITREQLKHIIKEELEKTLQEQEQERANLSPNMTAGELVKAIEAAIYVKQKGIAKEKAKSGIAKMGWAVIDTLAPLVGPAIRAPGEIIDVYKAVYDLPDDKKTKTANQMLSGIDIDRLLSKFIRKKYNQTKLEKGG